MTRRGKEGKRKDGLQKKQTGNVSGNVSGALTANWRLDGRQRATPPSPNWTGDSPRPSSRQPNGPSPSTTAGKQERPSRLSGTPPVTQQSRPGKQPEGEPPPKIAQLRRSERTVKRGETPTESSGSRRPPSGETRSLRWAQIKTCGD